MLLKIADLGRGTRHFDFAIHPDILDLAFEGRTDIEDDREAHAFIDVELIGRNVNIRGDIHLRIRTVCARCASDVEASLRLPWSLVLVPHREVPGPEVEDLGFGYYRGERLDLGRAACEHVGLMLPAVMVCDPECRGLCPGCGVNLNREACRCRPPREA